MNVERVVVYDGEIYRECDCSEVDGPCKFGAKRTLLAMQLTRCLIPLEPAEVLALSTGRSIDSKL